MQYLELLRWPHAGCLTINKTPVLIMGNLKVHELTSHFEHIDIRANEKFIARYNHVALQDNYAFIYDFVNKECKGSFGEFRLYEIAAGNKLQLIKEVASV